MISALLAWIISLANPIAVMSSIQPPSIEQYTGKTFVMFVAGSNSFLNGVVALQA